MPDDAEVWGLLALMLLHDARRAARVDASGRYVALDEQDRWLWDQHRTATASRGWSGDPPAASRARVAAAGRARDRGHVELGARARCHGVPRDRRHDAAGPTAAAATGG